MKCQFCGNENDDDALFCTMCGATFSHNNIGTKDVSETDAVSNAPMFSEGTGNMNESVQNTFNSLNSAPSPYAPQESVYYGKNESPYASQQSPIYGQNGNSPYIYQSPYTAQPQGIQNPYAQNSYNEPVYGQPNVNNYSNPGAGFYGGMAVTSNNRESITVMVLGIVSLALSATWMYWITSTAGLIVGIIGLVQANNYSRNNGMLNGKARTGKGLSLAGTIVGGIWTLVLFIIIAVAIAEN